MKKQQAAAVEDQTSNNDKILVLSPKLKRGRPRKTNMPRKIRKMAAEKLFPLVQTGQMSANDAFSKLLKKIKGEVILELIKKQIKLS